MISLKRLFIFLFCGILLVQCATDGRVSSRNVGRLLEQANNDLAFYCDDAAWEKAVAIEKFARENEIDSLVCKALVIKGKVCDYADVSEVDNRNDEALAYLQEAAFVADAQGMTYERALTRYLISEVYVNKNRWSRDSIDGAIYYLAGKWLDEGVRIADEAGISTLQRKAVTYRLRYLRQGNKFEDAIALCHEVINSCDEDDNLTLQQMYDQLMGLYTSIGDSESSAEAHAQYVQYTQQQIRQAKDESSSEGSSLWIVLAVIGVAIASAVAAGIFSHTKKTKAKAASAKEKKSPAKTLDALSINDLTPREKEIVRLMSEGMSTADLSRTLNVSARTVSNHKQNIYSKLGVNSSAEMLRLYEEYKNGSSK